MAEYIYVLNKEDGSSATIQTSCPQNEFEKTVDFVSSLDEYTVDTLLDVLRALQWEADTFEPDFVTHEFKF